MIENQLEQNIIEIINEQGYIYIYGPDIESEKSNSERESFEDVILVKRLRENISRLNPCISESVKRILGICTIDQTYNN